MEKMDAMLSDSGAWQSQYAQVSDDVDDELKVPQCGESFVTLVSAMTGQCLTLPVYSLCVNVILLAFFYNIIFL